MRLPHSQREFPVFSLHSLRFAQARRACLLISCLCCALLAPFLVKRSLSQEASIAVRGELQQELSLSLADLKAMPPFLIQDVPVIPDPAHDGRPRTIRPPRAIRVVPKTEDVCLIIGIIGEAEEIGVSGEAAAHPGRKG